MINGNWQLNIITITDKKITGIRSRTWAIGMFLKICTYMRKSMSQILSGNFYTRTRTFFLFLFSRC